jgi:long-chain acyl-CoA synthetase
VLDALRALPPDTEALVDDRHRYTASALADAIGLERDWLKARGGSRFALLADNGSGWVIADLALLDAQALHVPLPAYFTTAQVQHVLANAGIDRILTDQPERVQEQVPDASLLGTSPVTGLSLLACTPPSRFGKAPPGTVKVTYTSGSTGTPKGVCLGAAGSLAVADTLAAHSGTLGIQRHLCLLPLPTLLENLAGVLAPLRAGATCIVPSLATVGMSYGSLDAQRLLGAITTHQPNSLILVPELLRLLVVAAERGWPVPKSLAFIAVGGASVPRDLLLRAHAAGLPAFEGYGLTECTSVVTLNLPGASRIGSAGRPLPHVKVRVDDAGQVHVRGSLLLGYLGEDSPPPSEFATGDLGEIDADGYLHVRGRISNLFITSLGRNITPEWIESVLLQDPAIGQAIVTGEGRPHPVAVIAPPAATVPDGAIAQAIERANRSLPDYAAVRGWVRADAPFTFAAGLLTANGRPRRNAILARYAEDLASL